eukprot:scaffold6870_cov121-Cylindrotheca_fusiformis.AAC.19
MVSIRKAKKGFQVRQRGRAGLAFLSQYDKEKVGLLIISMTLGFLVVVAFVGVFSSSNAYDEQKRSNLSIKRAKHRPELKDSVGHKRLGDTMDAVASDIYETLDCDQLFKETVDKLKEESAKEQMDDDNMIEARRRLEEESLQQEQHGDDGVFEQKSSGDWGQDAEKALEEATDDKWGKAARGETVGRNGFGLDLDDKWGDLERNGDDKAGFDDAMEGGGWGDDFVEITGQHLFCLAASPTPPPELESKVQCDATKTKRKMLLDLWSSARAKSVDITILRKALDVAQERVGSYLVGKSYNLWAPRGDEGIDFLLNVLNSEKAEENGGILNLSECLGPGKLFVDVGSCLGLTTLAIAAKYPGTQIASIEPASPNWLLQEMNLRCNLDHDEFKNIKVVYAGVGPNDSDEDDMMAKMMWRAKSTTSTRSWTPANELEDLAENDIELVVRLQKLKTVLAEAEVNGPHTIDVMNVDCSGCEYNLIPTLTDREFNSIRTVLGGVHWGYIPASKLPSSARAKTTHERLCSHEYVALKTKECCAFPDMEVQSSVPGEALLKDNNFKGGLDKPSTVMDVIMDGLCDDFATWAEEKHLYTIGDDWGWFELSSRAAV